MTRTNHWVAECFRPGASDEELGDLDSRLVRAASELARTGGPASYLGCLRITDDDVVLFLFEGSISSVQQVAEGAGIRAERILHCVPRLRN